MLLLLGLVLGAAIDPVVTTSASLSPVSSVTSDASSSVTKRYIGLNLQDYESNILNARFQIPDYVLPPRDGNIAGFGGGGSEHPNNGGLALEVQFSAQQIWQAMNVRTIHGRPRFLIILALMLTICRPGWLLSPPGCFHVGWRTRPVHCNARPNVTFRRVLLAKICSRVKSHVIIAIVANF